MASGARKEPSQTLGSEMWGYGGWYGGFLATFLQNTELLLPPNKILENTKVNLL